MLYLCVGNDFNTRKHKVDQLVSTMHKKRPNAELITLDGTESHTLQTLQQHTSSLGLFDEKSIIKGLGLCEIQENKKHILGCVDDFVKSDNAFIFSELKLNKTEIKKISQGGGEVVMCEIPNTNTNHNLFYLGDLLLQKNKSQLWLAIATENNQGISTEELFGIIMWQTKSLYLVKTMSQKESGLKPFVYNKCNKSPWTQREAQNIHRELITIYHQSRRGGMKLSERLEQWVLGL